MLPIILKSRDYLDYMKQKHGKHVIAECINFIFLDNGTMIYDYNNFNGYVDAMIDAIKRGEDIDRIISLVFPEKADHSLIKAKLIKLL